MLISPWIRIRELFDANLGNSLDIFLQKIWLGHHEKGEGQPEQNLPSLAQKTV